MDGDSGATRTFTVGMRWVLSGMRGSLSWPLVQVVLNGSGVHLAPRFLTPGPLECIIPNLNMPYEEILRVERVGGTLPPSPSVRVDAGAMEKPIVFWTFKADAVLNALQGRGVLVERNRHRVSLFGV